MDPDNLPKDLQDELTMIGHRAEIEVEDDKRRQCTNFGYNRGGVQTMVLWMALTLVASVVGIFVLAFMAACATFKFSFAKTSSQ